MAPSNRFGARYASGSKSKYTMLDLNSGGPKSQKFFQLPGQRNESLQDQEDTLVLSQDQQLVESQLSMQLHNEVQDELYNQILKIKKSNTNQMNQIG